MKKKSPSKAQIANRKKFAIQYSKHSKSVSDLFTRKSAVEMAIRVDPNILREAGLSITKQADKIYRYIQTGKV